MTQTDINPRDDVERAGAYIADSMFKGRHGYPSLRRFCMTKELR